jgi:phage shock protein A
MMKKHNRRKYLRIWDDQVKELIENKKNLHEKWLSTKTVEDKIECKKATALAKREVRRRQRNSWDKSVTTLEHDLYETKPNTYKIVKHINKDLKETANIK